jgi:YebC/PmpR family DNA-binding regulatory protein
MAGHSHWAGIKHKKAANDAKRGKIFSKMAKEIMVAARLGGGDPNMNVRLRHAIDKARAVSMPRDNIERAVKKGSGEGDGAELVEIVYEGYGPGGVALLVECLSDNTNRTYPELRKIFDTAGGSIGKNGTVQWKFRKVGLIAVAKEAAEEDALLEICLEAGADDVSDQDEVWEIVTPAEAYDDVCTALQEKGIETQMQQITQLADQELELDPETAEKALRLMERLEEHDDVQNVYADFSPSEEILAKMEA